MTKEVYWNIEDWQSENGRKLSERKKEWACIQQNLKVFSTTEFSGKYLAHHKKLFFEGSVQPDNYKHHGDSEFQFMLPLFVMWYHPNLSEQVTERIIDWGCESWSNALTMSKCRELIAKVGMRAPRLHEEYGLFGRRERVIVEAFWGEPLIGTRFDQVQPASNEGGTLMRAHLISDSVAMVFWSAVVRRLTNGSKFEHAYGQYLYQHAQAVSHLITSSISHDYIRTAASNVLFFNESPIADHASESSQAMRDIMIQRYEDGEFHKIVQDIWDDVKAGNKNFYE